MRSRLIFFSISLLFIVTTACKKETTTTSNDTSFVVDFESYTLANGLKVILHKDTSDPVVAVALTAHVGSAREKQGRTGFAHLFEHLLFLESENLGKGGLDKMSARIGGSGANGSTSRDRTNYYQTVPKDALEKMLWAEADKLGYFINTVTEPVLAKEKQVVKNEKRQRVDNQPYGHTNYVIGKNLYPEGHPYNWQVIGSLDDLQNATLQDVKDFYNRWYVPNNVVLTIAGDFDVAQTKAWVKKYFEEIPKGEDVSRLEKQPVTLDSTKRLYYEDNFARLPQLTLTWPTVPVYHEDYYALDILSTYLSNGKKAPLNNVLVEDQKLTDNVSMYQYAAEIAGELSLRITAFNDIDLDTVQKGIEQAFKNFETQGIPQADLDRIKAGEETNFYSNLSSVLGKGFQLAQYEIYTGNANYINEDLKHFLAVTPEDVMRVYNTYIKNKPYVATSFVPKTKKELALANSLPAKVVEEQIIEGAEETFDAGTEVAYEKTASSFDRSIEPPYGPAPDITLPVIWKDTLTNGIKIYGIESAEVPLVQFQITLLGGFSLENPSKTGISNLVAQLLTKGTKNKTPEQLEEAIEQLGASVRAYNTEESIVISGTTLSKHYASVMQLVEEVLLEPRWDETEFDLLKKSTLSRLERNKANPNAIANDAFARLVYGENHIFGYNTSGTDSSVEAITLSDLKDYYNRYFSPNVTLVLVAGNVNKNQVAEALDGLQNKWETKPVTLPELAMPEAPKNAKIYFYDVPNAKQSVLYFGYPALTATDTNYYPAIVMNYRLGGGSFASQLTQQLREDKGYTYGIYSTFEGNKTTGTFSVASGVRSNVTFESTALIKDILSKYGENYNESDLDVTKSYMLKSGVRQFETLNAKLNILSNISNYGYADDYLLKRQEYVKNMTVEDIKKLCQSYITPNAMFYVIVGDKATQMKKLEQLGFGEPVLLTP